MLCCKIQTLMKFDISLLSVNFFDDEFNQFWPSIATYKCIISDHKTIKRYKYKKGVYHIIKEWELNNYVNLNIKFN